MQISINRRVALLGGAAVLGLAGAAAVVNFRHRSLPRERGLIGHWSFDDGAGGTIVDASGLGNDGVVLPAILPDTWPTGEFAGALSLAGRSDNFVRVPPSDSLNTIRSSITVAAYVYGRSQWTPESSTGGFVALVQRQWRTTLHPDLYYLGFGVDKGVQYYKWHLGLVGSEASIDALPANEAAPKSRDWVHIAGTYDSTVGQMVLYVNGSEIASRAAKGAIRLDDGSYDRPLAIGAELNTASIDDASGEFDGYIDDVRLYDRALDAAEIKALALDAASSRLRQG